jgi:hypothetical protein
MSLDSIVVVAMVAVFVVVVVLHVRGTWKR